MIPTVFVSHGSPTLSIENVPARQFLIDLGARYPSVRAVLCISAHWNTDRPCVNIGKTHETIHDFYGFPGELYRIEYPCAGSPDLAAEVVDHLKKAGLPCDVDPTRGLDHGAWVPLRLMFPDGGVPIVQLSIHQGLDPAYHVALGEVISDVRETGVLVLGSGGAVHPLGNPQASLGPGAPTDDWALEFNTWLTHAVTSGDREVLSTIVPSLRMPARPTRTRTTICHFLSRLEQLDQKHEGGFFTRAGISGISGWVRLSLPRNKKPSAGYRD